eukprot:CAMPEP_0194398162 /NCGR_PEP_ID=MMETSP0174-20130528/125952_1 /TAXON_ID=216777 /ORGANISM="Proboscia alata, Strain PI-D3" /LENGTH=87 /DNA_ID=CAMNT_0039194431 /DNA_START=557 /DNA_END=820 /DNA_ORIENTATION=+
MPERVVGGIPVRFGFYSVLVYGNTILTTRSIMWYTSQHSELVGEVPPKRHTSCTVINNFEVYQNFLTGDSHQRTIPKILDTSCRLET